MSIQVNQVKALILDHFGLVSAVATDLGIVGMIDARLPTTDRSHATMGQRTLAMILNGLGFLNDRLYMVPRFFQNKPLERLIGPGVKAEHLNDDALGRLLDSVAEYGTTKLFGEIAFEIGSKQGLIGRSAHLDTTSLMVVTHGYSKDYRNDLKQVVLSLTTTGPAGFPIWFEALAGNSSDKVSFHETRDRATEFQKQLSASHFLYWVADSCLYTVGKLLSVTDTMWIPGFLTRWVMQKH
ncbi:MAG: IS1634 family transposase [Magnetococcales bacterium]|nr:IS1634 family transposase [Magnetococcales bacterium]